MGFPSVCTRLLGKPLIMTRLRRNDDECFFVLLKPIFIICCKLLHQLLKSLIYFVTFHPCCYLSLFAFSVLPFHSDYLWLQRTRQTSVVAQKQKECRNWRWSFLQVLGYSTLVVLKTLRHKSIQRCTNCDFKQTDTTIPYMMPVTQG